MEDQVAISYLKRGDLGGLESLVKRYQAQAVHTAYLILHDRSLAEDVVQTAYIKVAERVQQFDDTRPFAPWFFRIVANDALKVAKKQQRILPLPDQVDEPAAQLAEWLVDPGPEPEQVLEREEMRQLILRALRSLPPEQRTVVVMRYFVDMPLSDMVSATNRPLSTIKWWLRDARQRLRRLIHETI
jgi:RNA polymerase sigma-70 factor, ECF subfamily